MNVSFDLETLGKTPKAPIIQIGAVVFKDTGEILDKYNKSCNFETIPEGFQMDYSTIQWWFSQLEKHPELHKSFEKLIHFSHEKMIRGFASFISDNILEHGHLDFWSHMNFDPGILDNNFKPYFDRKVIPYSWHNDLRTLKRICKSVVLPKREGNHHDALDDSEHQANEIAACFKFLKDKENPTVVFRQPWNLLEFPKTPKESFTVNNNNPKQ